MTYAPDINPYAATAQPTYDADFNTTPSLPLWAKGAAVLALPALLPLVIAWRLWAAMSLYARGLWYSAADVSYPDTHLCDTASFTPSMLYSGPSVATQSAVLNQGAFGQISALVYLYRPKTLERPITELIERPMVLAEFILRVSPLSRAEVFRLGTALSACPELLLSCLFRCLGRQSLFSLSSGLSPEAPIPD